MVKAPKSPAGADLQSVPDAGTFNNQYRPGVFGITAGSINYMARAYQLAQSRQSYYQSLGIPPGPPTLKGIYGEPETTGNALP